MKYQAYRVTNAYGPYGPHYKPLIRNGEPVRFKTKVEGDNWLEENKPTSKVFDTTFEVRRIIKQVT